MRALLPPPKNSSKFRQRTLPPRNAPQPPHFFLNDLLDNVLLFRRHPPDDRLVDVENRRH